MEHQKLKELREAAKLKQAEVARQLQISRSTYTKYETGDSEPNHQMLKRLADLFNVTTDYLLGKDNKGSENHNTAEDELDEYLEALRSRPEMRMLFSLAKGATKEDVEKAVTIIEALSKHE